MKGLFNELNHVLKKRTTTKKLVARFLCGMSLCFEFANRRQDINVSAHSAIQSLWAE